MKPDEKDKELAEATVTPQKNGKDQLKTDEPLSEKDEVKKAEEKTARPEQKN